MDSNNYDFIFKVLLLGDQNVGKSSVLRRFRDGIFKQNEQGTIGVDFTLKTIFVDGKTVKLQVWDTAGQERFRTITQSYYRKANGVIICFDLTRAETFEHVTHWLDEVTASTETNLCKILVGNKSDLPIRQIQYTQASSYAQENNFIDFLETSAKENTNVEDAFVKLAKELVRQQSGSSLSIVSPSAIVLSPQRVGSSWLCCGYA